PYQAYSHYGAFYSTDGGQTFASSYWHVPNPDLKPQTKKTLELNVLRELGGNVELSAAAFYSRFNNIVNESDAAQAYSGLYHGWPVDYIDFAVNQGNATAYGSTLGLTFLRSLGVDRRFKAHAGVTMVDGVVLEGED